MAPGQATQCRFAHPLGTLNRRLARGRRGMGLEILLDARDLKKQKVFVHSIFASLSFLIREQQLYVSFLYHHEAVDGIAGDGDIRAEPSFVTQPFQSSVLSSESDRRQQERKINSLH
ncbi:hypothetical protein GQ43DRAFT_10195 [Delitschia confertaspora ATCC 74209]|uniref:Uncharacterized protein n=1 Tax=Delitschia confertaspora ATCC 74209 TaxID=1513339 RepID=A0A9P4JPN0_9PLEO|nr:hypothetical protein GQ43DRAFT_10195 [Delitschia confertaspora ATCC 74209]